MFWPTRPPGLLLPALSFCNARAFWLCLYCMIVWVQSSVDVRCKLLWQVAEEDNEYHRGITISVMVAFLLFPLWSLPLALLLPRKFLLHLSVLPPIPFWIVPSFHIVSNAFCEIEEGGQQFWFPLEKPSSASWARCVAWSLVLLCSVGPLGYSTCTIEDDTCSSSGFMYWNFLQ